MSASREQKDGQNLFPAGLSEKQRKSQKETAERRHKKIVYTIVGVISVIAVAALLIWNSGIVQRGYTVISVGDTNYTAADFDYYYYQVYNQEYNYSKNYSAYGITTFDYETSPADQTYTDSDTGETMTYRQYFINTAEDNLKQVTAVVNAANEAGYTLSQDGKDSVQSSIDSMKSSARSDGYSYSGYLKLCYGDYMTKSAYEQCLTRAELASEYYSTYQDSLSYTDDDYNSYYSENKDALDTYEYSYLCFTASVDSTDADGNTLTDDEIATSLEEEKVFAQSDAQAALAALQSGTSIADLITTYSPTSSGDDSATVGSSLSSLYSSWLEDSSRTAGDSDIVEYDGGDTSYSYYVMLFTNRYQDETPTVDIRHILIKAELPTDDTSTTDVDESSDTPTDDAMQTAHDKAADLLNQWTSGDQTAESFGDLADANSEDTGSNTNGGLYENVTEGQMFDAFNTWIMDSSRQPGDTTLIENTQSGQYGWHVVYFQSWENPVWKNSADSSLRSDDVQTWLDGLTDALTATHTNHFDSMVAV
ncbi:MAG: peptidylprolyl isomerase [Oscillospiraceae bacterium]|nr:peptidylprolyl isomerase [Oscillospiraceae bacterium]